MLDQQRTYDAANPRYALRVTSEPYAEPVSLAEVKEHCRIDGTDSDSILWSWLLAARLYVEDFTNRAMVTTTYKMTFDRFPYGAYWPFGITPEVLGSGSAPVSLRLRRRY